MAKTPSLFAIGTPVIDYFAKVQSGEFGALGLKRGSTNHFLEGEKIGEMQKKLKIIAKVPGDNARNACEGFSSLGGKTEYFGAVGNDEDGKFFLDGLERAKIGSLVGRISKHSTGRIIALIDEGFERTFAAYLGAGLELEGKEIGRIGSADFFYTTSITTSGKNKTAETAKKALKNAKERGVRIAYSIESPKMAAEEKERIWEEVNEFADILFANEEELKALGRNMEEITSRVKIFCLKRGANGSEIYSEGKVVRIPAQEVESVIDTTGAGDWYAGGFLFGIGSGKNAKESGDIASKLASRIMGRLGASLKY